MRRIAGGGGVWSWGGTTMPAEHRDVYQPLAMDDGIVYRPNLNGVFCVFRAYAF